MSITTKVESSNSVHGEVYSIQHFVIKFVSDLQQVGGFLWVLRFPPPIKANCRHRGKSIPLIYMTADFPNLVQAFQ